MILSYQDMIEEVKRCRQGNQVAVLATGVFDVLHYEHIQFLTNAKQQGSLLVVGLESDARVTELKGSDRPINSITSRLDQINSLPPVDIAFELPIVSDWLACMKQICPDMYCVSSESPFLENKKNVCRQAGIELKVVHQHNPQVSTSQLIRQKNLHQEVK